MGLHREWCIYISLVTIYMSRSGWGLDSALLYYVVIFLATTGCSCLILVNGPYDFYRYTYSMIC